MSLSTFRITEPASDISLLTLEELRAAIGIADASQDEQLLTLALQAYERLANECRLRRDGVTPPTFRLEALSETFRDTCTPVVYLSRKPVVSITSITEDDVSLVEGVDYEINASSAALRRLDANGNSISWWFSTLVVEYSAGWDEVPSGLKGAASSLVRLMYQQGNRDPAVREVEVPGVIRRGFYDFTEVDLPLSISTALVPYASIII